MKNTDKIDISLSVPASGASPSPPVVKAAGVSILRAKVPAPDIRKRVAIYVDGFNLYHAIDKLGEPHLKWLNLYALGERLLNRNEERLVRAYYVSAKKPDKPDKNERHQHYINALKHAGVECQLGHFITEEVQCHGCARKWGDDREKESDISLALAVIDDAHRDEIDVALVVTADSDQAATARMMKLRFPEKEFVSIIPPGMAASHAIRTYARARVLPKAVIEECLLPQIVTRVVDGREVPLFERPSSYDPPAGWMPERQRKLKLLAAAEANAKV